MIGGNWFGLAILRHASIGWLAFKSRLPTCVGLLNGATKGIHLVCSEGGASWKIGLTCALRVPSLVESGRML